MSDVYGYILAVVLAFAFGVMGGWVHAHQTVATECQRLGSFYVASTTYECKAKP